MKNLLFLLLCFALSLVASAQVHRRDSTIQPLHRDSVGVSLKDTVAVPIYETHDTVAVNYLYFNKGNKVLYGKGYVISTGFKDNNRRGRPRWLQQPKVQLLDNRFKPVKNIIQIYPVRR